MTCLERTNGKPSIAPQSQLSVTVRTATLVSSHDDEDNEFSSSFNLHLLMLGLT